MIVMAVEIQLFFSGRPFQNTGADVNVAQAKFLISKGNFVFFWGGGKCARMNLSGVDVVISCGFMG